MTQVNARKVVIDADKVIIRTLLRSFSLSRNDITGYQVGKIPSLYDEIAISLKGSKEVIVTERVQGFFDLAKFLDIEKSFGPLWYREAEDGRKLDK